MIRTLHRPLIALALAATLVPAALANAPLTDDDPLHEPASRRVISSLAALLLSGLLVLILTIGAYLVIRIGRVVAQKPRALQPTEYVDAWSRYRISESEVESAMRRLADEPPAGDEPAPEDGPPDPDPRGPN